MSNFYAAEQLFKSAADRVGPMESHRITPQDAALLDLSKGLIALAQALRNELQAIHNDTSHFRCRAK